MVVWQPPLSIFDQGLSPYWVGDMILVLTHTGPGERPRLNLHLEHIRSEDVHRKGSIIIFIFLIKSIRFYIACQQYGNRSRAKVHP